MVVVGNTWARLELFEDNSNHHLMELFFRIPELVDNLIRGMVSLNGIGNLDFRLVDILDFLDNRPGSQFRRYNLDIFLRDICDEEIFDRVVATICVDDSVVGICVD